jgi:hypothetical protein
MTIEFRFTNASAGTGFNSLRAELYRMDIVTVTDPITEVEQTIVTPHLLESETIQNNRVAFNRILINNYCLGVVGSEGTVFRTDILQTDDFFVDTDDSDAPQLGMLVTTTGAMQESGVMSFTIEELRERLPQPPLVFALSTSYPNLMELTELELNIIGSVLEVKGEGKAISHPAPYADDVDPDDGDVVFPFDYTYRFTLSPYRSIHQPTRLFTITPETAYIEPTATGFWGGVVNFLVSFLLGFFRDNIRSTLESAVQSSLDASLATWLLTGEARTVTLAEVKTNPDGVTVDGLAWVRVVDTCACAPSSGSIRLRPPKQMRQLRLIEMRVLRGTVQGEAYLALLRRYNRELIELFITQPELLRSLDVAIARLLQDFKGGDLRKGKVSPPTSDALFQLGEMIARIASPELRAVVTGLLKDAKAIVGQPIDTMLFRR